MGSSNTSLTSDGNNLFSTDFQIPASEYSRIPRRTLWFCFLIIVVLLSNQVQISSAVLFHSKETDSEQNKFETYVLIPAVLLTLSMFGLFLHRIAIEDLKRSGYDQVVRRSTNIYQFTCGGIAVGYTIAWITWGSLFSCEFRIANSLVSIPTNSLTKHIVLFSMWSVLDLYHLCGLMAYLFVCMSHNQHEYPPDGCQIGPRVHKSSQQYSGRSSVIEQQAHHIRLLERQISTLSHQLIEVRCVTPSKHKDMENYSYLLRKKTQEYRAVVAEKDLLQSEVDSRTRRIEQFERERKRQRQSIEELERIREDNRNEIAELRREVSLQSQELEKCQIFLRMERERLSAGQRFY